MQRGQHNVARSKKQVWRPHVQTLSSFGSKCTVVKEVLVTCWDF